MSKTKIKSYLLLLIILIFALLISRYFSSEISKNKSTQVEDFPPIAWVLSEKDNRQFVDLSGGEGKANFALFLNELDASIFLKHLQSVNPKLANSSIILVPVNLAEAIKSFKQQNQTCTIFKNPQEGFSCEKIFNSPNALIPTAAPALN